MEGDEAVIKRVQGALYFLLEYIDTPVFLDELVSMNGELPARFIIDVVSTIAAVSPASRGANMCRVETRVGVVTLLTYDFSRDHPELLASIRHVITDHRSGQGMSFIVQPPRRVSTKNPPVLHRCELYFPPGTPEHERFAAVTAIDEAAGMFDPAVVNRIGTRKGTARVLASREHR